MSSTARLNYDVHTVQDHAHQRLAVVVENLPQCKGLLRRVGEQAEQDGECVVRGQAFRVEESDGDIEAVVSCCSTIINQHHVKPLLPRTTPRKSLK